MSLFKVLSKRERLSSPTVTSLNKLESASKRVLDRWPDVVSEVPERDRERLVQFVKTKLDSNNWKDTKLSLVTRAARVIFDKDFCQRTDLENLRSFYIEETRASTRQGFLAAMVSVYLTTYQPKAPHTSSLAGALKAAHNRLGAKWQNLLKQFPHLFDAKADERLASLMAEMDDPWRGLKALGFQSPHAPGLMDHAHLAYVRAIGTKLSAKAEIDRLLGWLKPEGHEAKASGAAEAISALLEPWQKAAPSDGLRAHLVDHLVDLYGDPRIVRGAPWSGVNQGLKEIVFRWLTREDIIYFMDVVSAAEDSHMWPERRKFWLGLHKKNQIDAAWVAFSYEAQSVARQQYSKLGARASRQYGIQEARGTRSKTSLLILKIGNCIVVEGSHNYKVHIFRASNKAAPKLFVYRYNCEIVRGISGSKTVMHLGNWQGKVNEMIGYFS